MHTYVNMRPCYPAVLFFLYLVLCHYSFTAYAQSSSISGRVYYDFNLNGRIDIGEGSGERGASGIPVSAYDVGNNLVASSLTGDDGRYTLVVSEGCPLKIYFTLPEAALASCAPEKFVTSPAEGIDIGYTDPSSYKSGKNLIFSSILRNGGIDVTKGIDSLTTLIVFSPDSAGVQRLADFGQTGTVWGLAYDRFHSVLLSAAMAKRHSGYGPLGSGGIYMTSLDSINTRPFFSLDQLGIKTSEHVEREFPEMIDGVGRDSSMFDRIGKSGLGGIALSEKGDLLFSVNLYDRNVYAFPVPGNLNVPSGYEKYRLPGGICNGGILRPFAIKWHTGSLYAGCICDASASGLAQDLSAEVFELNIDSKKFRRVLSFPLIYERGKMLDGIEESYWNPWTGDFSRSVQANSPSTAIYPQPILSSIDFDHDGNMFLGIMDRFGRQAGTGHPDPAGSGTFVAVAGGDILLAQRKRSSRFSLEGAGNPKNGVKRHTRSRSFDTAFESEGVRLHESNVSGGIAVLSNNNRIVVSQHEPTDVFNVSGAKVLDILTRKPLHGIDFFPVSSPGTFGKVNAVGSLESLSEIPPSAIGSRVWIDRNGNNIQDAGEKGMKNITVVLVNGDKEIASVLTDAEGKYQFSGSFLQPETDYEVKLKLPETFERYKIPAYKVNLRHGSRRRDMELKRLKTCFNTIYSIQPYFT